MAVLRPFGGLIRALVSDQSICQLILIPQILRNKTFRGYVVPSPEIFENRSSFKVENEILVPSINKTSRGNKKFSHDEFEDHLVTLSIGFANMNVRYNNLLAALSLYSNIQDNTFDSSATLLLSCCGEVLCEVEQNVRQNLTKHVWNLLQKKIQNLSLEHYHTLLEIHSQNNEKIDPQEFLRSMQVKPDERTFLLLMKVAGRCGDFDAAKVLLENMKKLEYELSQDVFDSVLEVYWTRGDIDSAVSTLETMIAKGVEPLKKMYANLACGYAKFGDIENVLTMLKNHSFEGKQVLQIIKHLVLSSNGKYVSEVLKYLPTNEIVCEPILTNSLAQFVLMGKPDEAEEIFKYFLTKENISQTVHLVEQFLFAIATSKQPVNKTIELSKLLCTIHEPKNVFIKLLEGSLRSSHSKLALAVLDEMKVNKIEIRNHYFWPLLVQASKRGESNVFEIIKYILSLEISLDHETLLKFIFPHITTANPLITLKKLTDCGLKSSQVQTPLICFLLEERRTTEAIYILDSTNGKNDFHEIVKSLMKSCDIKNNKDGCAKVLKFAPSNKDFAGIFLEGLFKKNSNKLDPSVLEDFIDTFKKYNISISSDIAEPLSEQFFSSTGAALFPDAMEKLKKITDGRLRRLNSERVSGIPHPKNMILEQLECHLIELKAKGLNYRGLLRKLLMAHCKKGNLDRVEQLRGDFQKSKMTMTPAMKAHLFDLYAQHGRVGEVCSLFLDLSKNHKDFMIDSFKLVRAAIALVKHQKVETALEIINNNGPVTRKVPSDCWKLLDEIAQSEFPEMTEVALENLVEKGYCDMSNTLMGPLIRRHILKNDWASAVEAFDKLARDYQETPLRQELIGHLVEAGKEKLLKIVLVNVERIYGQDTVDLEMVIAYARHGMIKELKDSLKNLDQPSTPWEKFTQNISDGPKAKILMPILDASYGLDGFNRLKIYELLLAIYCRTGNCQEASKAWEKMKLEGIVPTSTLRENFVSLLSAHHIPLPQEHPGQRKNTNITL